MQTIKTAVVVVLLLIVLYMGYIAINGSQELPPELKKMLAEDTELGIDVSIPGAGADAAVTKPGTGLTQTQGFPTSGASSSPSGFWNAHGSSPAANPDTLTPPKLTSIPSFPPANSGSSPSTFPTPEPLKPENAPPTTPTPALNKLTVEEPTNKPEVFSQPVGSSGIPKTSSTTPSPFSIPSTSTPPSVPVAQAIPPSGLKMPENLDPPKSPDSVDKGLGESQAPKKANLTGRSFDNVKKAAMEKIDQNDFKSALAMLSVFYNSPELSSEQSQDLLNLLDSVAGETIYSRRHLMEQPYVVGPGETIDSIAKKYEVPPELLAKINGIDTTLGPMPGTRLKVFQGPFRAEVDVKRNEMTLLLGELYAGRFPISTGADPQPKEGVFQVLDKQRNRNYYGKGGIQIEGNDPRNPYGGLWIDLGQELSIHSSANAQGGDNANLGCISLSPQDAGDVFSMLSRGSQVTIKR